MGPGTIVAKAGPACFTPCRGLGAAVPAVNSMLIRFTDETKSGGI